MDILGEYEEIGILDLMEVAPKLDPTESTQRLAANAIVRFIESRFI
jgi:agmatinase